MSGGQFVGPVSVVLPKRVTVNCPVAPSLMNTPELLNARTNQSYSPGPMFERLWA